MLSLGTGGPLVPAPKALAACCLPLDLRGYSMHHPRNITWTLLLARLLVSALLFAPVAAQQPFGFVSIDCGGVNHLDPITGIEWVSDSAFLNSANELADEGTAIAARVELDDAEPSSRDNAEQQKTALAFIPDHKSRSKYCYNLNVSYNAFNSTNYLVRAIFPSSNLTALDSANVSLNVYGTRFYFTVDSTFVKTIDLDPFKSQIVELVVTPLDWKIFICLVPLEDRSSMPAISSLELRRLSGNLYDRRSDTQANTASDSRLQTTYLITVSRLNFGGEEDLPAVRYPSDPYDRLWYPARIPEEKLSDIKASRSNLLVQPDTSINTPSVVLSSAWEGVNMSSEISFTFNIREAQRDRPVPTFYINMLFLDINPGGGNGSRFENITLESTGLLNSTVDWAVNAVVGPDVFLWYNYKEVFVADFATFKIKPNGSSTLPAMVNALELYGEFEAVTERTAQVDATSIVNFTNSFAAQVDTAGDPCLPVAWDWLVCSIEIPPRITQINLTGKGVTGELDTQFGLLDRLTVLDLSNNSFYGSMPSSLVDVVTLRALNLAHNNLSGELPPFVPNSLVNLESLSLRDNTLSGSLWPLVRALADTVSTLDLSHNQFTGSMPVELGELINLQSLDMSYNELSGKLAIELVNLPLVKNLYLQMNGLDGMVPDQIWSSGSKLENVVLNNNRFTELNLTTWSQLVLERKSFDAYGQKVSLLLNDIRNVILPSEDDFERIHRPSETGLISPSGFILLGENPWCRKLNMENATLVQRYLCRSDEHDDFWSPRLMKGVDRRVLAAIGVTSGLLILLMSFILLVSLWKVWKRMKELRQIQEALAKDDVRPPFFKYEDLKLATDDFSKANELGKGAFGAVYKAVLGDGSIVAVKRLFPTELNVTDFLKEMVLITGIKHRNLVQLKGCCVRDKQRMLVYEYAENENLAEALWGHKKLHELTWAQRVNICVGIARGLAYLHEELHPKIIHRDIKPQNILLDKDLNPKIADFGLARPAGSDDATQMSSHVGGTLGYFSPEYATLGVFNEKLDVYSYGILVLEIVSGRRCIDFSLPEDEVYLRTWAFKLYEEDRLLNMSEMGLVTMSTKDEIILVLKTALSCLQEDPSKRPAMSQVVNMLMGNSDLAIDLIKELKCQKLTFDDIFDGSILNELDKRQEEQVRGMMYSTSSESSQLIRVDDMVPR
ncbi:hypothetical protein Mapa_004419 [Marchantia paleacea]|nr:hypothetical protein Mapa_004419 [Marchantia paleacea]